MKKSFLISTVIAAFLGSTGLGYAGDDPSVPIAAGKTLAQKLIQQEIALKAVIDTEVIGADKVQEKSEKVEAMKEQIEREYETMESVLTPEYATAIAAQAAKGKHIVSPDENSLTYRYKLGQLGFPQDETALKNMGVEAALAEELAKIADNDARNKKAMAAITTGDNTILGALTTAKAIAIEANADVLDDLLAADTKAYEDMVGAGSLTSAEAYEALVAAVGTDWEVARLLRDAIEDSCKVFTVDMRAGYSSNPIPVIGGTSPNVTVIERPVISPDHKVTIHATTNNVDGLHELTLSTEVIKLVQAEVNKATALQDSVTKLQTEISELKKTVNETIASFETSKKIAIEKYEALVAMLGTAGIKVDRVGTKGKVTAVEAPAAGKKVVTGGEVVKTKKDIEAEQKRLTETLKLKGAGQITQEDLEEAESLKVPMLNIVSQEELDALRSKFAADLGKEKTPTTKAHPAKNTQILSGTNKGRFHDGKGGISKTRIVD